MWNKFLLILRQQEGDIMTITKNDDCANSYTLRMTRGDDEVFSVGCRNLLFTDGCIIKFTVRKTLNSSNILIQKTITEFTDGKARIAIVPEDTKSLAFGKYICDVELTHPQYGVKTIIKLSDFIIDGEVTYDY